MQTQERLAPPSAPGEWTLKQIQEAIGRKLPGSMVATRQQGGQMLTYIPWYTANRILDKYCPGWSWEIRSMVATSDRLFLVGRLTIPAREGNVYREATGTETLKEQSKGGQVRELAYGDPSSNAESMAFRRAAARFGLGLYLYERE